ncbi:tandem-95 repeat protein [Leptothrix sp. BB-4]
MKPVQVNDDTQKTAVPALSQPQAPDSPSGKPMKKPSAATVATDARARRVEDEQLQAPPVDDDAVASPIEANLDDVAGMGNAFDSGIDSLANPGAGSITEVLAQNSVFTPASPSSIAATTTPPVPASVVQGVGQAAASGASTMSSLSQLSLMTQVAAGAAVAGSVGALVQSVTKVPVNQAPKASGSATLSAVNEDVAAPTGATVNSLFAKNFSDNAHELAAVAVTANASTAEQGKWQFSKDGTTWAEVAVNGLSDGAALYLASATLLRFMPAPNYAGEPGALTVRLVDNSGNAKGSGDTVDVSQNGGSTAFSSTTVSLATRITAVNDAPTAADTAIAATEDVIKTGKLAAATDIEGDSVSYTLAIGAVHGTVDVKADGSYTYAPKANYNGADSFTYTVSDGKGGSNTYTATLTVGAVNDNPTASDLSIAATEDVFKAGQLAVASDVDGDSVSYKLATGPAHGTVLIKTDGSYSYTPAADYNGSDSFTYTVSDNNGGSNTYTATVTIGAVNDAPTAADTTIAVKEDVIKTGNLATATDVDGDSVTFRLTTGATHGTIELNADGSYSYTAHANFNGADTFTYTVSDGKGGSNSYTASVTVGAVNDAPTASDLPIVATEDVFKTGQLAAAADVDGDSVSYKLASGPAHGTVVIKTDGSYSYTPAADYNGADTFTYTVSDSNGGSNTYTATVTVGAVNDAPTAADTAIAAKEDAIKTGNLATAKDVDGDAVSFKLATSATHGDVTVNADGSYTYNPHANFNGADSFTYTVSDGKGGSSTYTASVTVGAVNDAPTASDMSIAASEGVIKTGSLAVAVDVDRDDITYALATGAAHGTVEVKADGSYSYASHADYSGSDSFAYKVSDGKGGSNTYTVEVTVGAVNAAPTAADTTISAKEDVLKSGNLATATDSDGDSVTFRLATDAIHGTVEVKADGSYSYMADANYNGTDSFTYTVSDGKGGSNTYTATVTVGAVNDAPMAADVSIDVTEDGIRKGYLPTATDIDGDDVTYDLDTDADNGFVVINADGSYTYTPDANYSGTDTFSYVVSDGKGGSSTYTVEVEVGAVNDAPTAADKELKATEDVVLKGSLPTATDVDGDDVTYKLATSATHGAVSVDADGSYVYTPNANFNGTDTFTYTVSDGKGGSNTYTASVTVSAVNDKPTAADMAIAVTEDVIQSGKLATATDVDGDSVSYKLVTDAAHGTVVIKTDGSYSYTPTADYNGSDSFTYTVSDSNGGSNTYTATVTVAAANDAPTAADSTFAAKEDVIKTGNLATAKDVDGDSVSYKLATDAIHGTVEVKADGSYSYTADANYNGTDSFTYTVSDGKGGSNTYTATVTVGAVNDAPTAADVSIDATEDGIRKGYLPNAMDIDGDDVTYDLDTDADNGFVVINADGSYTYTPDANYSGTDTFSYVVSDGKGGSSTYTVEVEVGAVNDAPTAADKELKATEDVVLKGSLPTATDVDGDDVTYKLATSATHGAVSVDADGSYVYTPNANFNGTDTFTYTVSDGKGGSNTYTASVTVSAVNDKPTAADVSIAMTEDVIKKGYLPTATDIDGDDVTYAIALVPDSGFVVIKSDGSYTYTPDKNFNGADSFSYTVSDGKGGSNTYTVEVTVAAVNDAPTGADEELDATENVALEGSLSTAKDVDGDDVTYKLATSATHGTVAVNEDGSYTYTPNAYFNGTDTFTYTVSDGKGGSNTYTATVTVGAVNDAPTAAYVSIEATEDVITKGYLPAATDVDGDDVTYALEYDADHGKVVVYANGSYTYTPDANYNGTDAFSYTVSDDNGGSNTYSVEVTVGVVNDAPTAADKDLEATEDVVLKGSLPTATDVDGDDVTYKLATSATHGAVVVKADGSYTYTPNANFNGTDTFTYTVSDSDGGHNTYTATVTVGAVNDKPTLSTVRSFADFTEDTFGEISFAQLAAAADAADVDGDVLKFRIEAISSGSLQKWTGSAWADVVAGTTIVAQDDKLQWKGAANANGTLNAFTVKAWDGAAASDQAVQVKVNVGAVQDAPTLTRVDDLNGFVPGAFTEITYAQLLAAGNATDVDGDPLSFRIEAVSTGTLQKWSGAAWQDVTAGTTMLGKGEKLQWQSEASASGTLNAFTVKAWDGKEASATAIQVKAEVAATGFGIVGTGSGAQVGFSVSGAGDVNGDGFDDLIVGAPNSDNGVGSAYVIWGHADGQSVDLSKFGMFGISAPGFKLFSASGYTFGVGYSVSAAGDLNGDGLSDLIVGAPASLSEVGRAYVVYGKKTGFDVGVDSMSSSVGMSFSDSGTKRIGASVSSAGDVNGDGMVDFIIGASADNSQDGKSYVVFGTAGGGGSFNDLVNVDNGSGGFTIYGETGVKGEAGSSVSGAGDFNGDGLADLIMGAPQAASNGKSYLVFGKSGTEYIDLSQHISSSDALEIFGEAQGDYAGYSVSSAGDVNGDGLADLVIGAPNVEDVSTGKSYVVFGTSIQSPIKLADIAAGTGGFAITAPNSYGYSGGSVSSAGDVNGDGLSDLIIGQYGYGDGNGRSYVVFGKVDGGSVDLSKVDEEKTGFAIDSQVSGGQAGRSVSAAGDVNGDGLADLIVGEYAANNRTGSSTVLFGSASGVKYASAVDQYGTVNPDKLVGTSAGETLVGNRGNDVLTGNGGADVLYGGLGDDVFVLNEDNLDKLAGGVVNGQRARIDGGAGIDTIQLACDNVTFDLTIMANVALGNAKVGALIQSVERIDLHGEFNTLALTERDVLEMTGMNLFNGSNGWTGLPSSVNKHQLIVTGDDTNSVALYSAVTNGPVWSRTVSDILYGGELYSAYTTGNGLEVLVNQNLRVI